MKKLIAIFTVTLCMAFALCACGSKPQENPSGPDAPQGSGTEVSAGLKDVGDFSVLVPEGWFGAEATDVFSEDQTIRTDMYYLVKGGKSAADVLLKPCVTVTLYKDMSVEDQYESLSWIVDEMKDVSYTARGAECKAVETKSESWVEEGQMDTSYYIFLPEGEGCFELSFSGEELTLDDPDIQAIADSLMKK